MVIKEITRNVAGADRGPPLFRERIFLFPPHVRDRFKRRNRIPTGTVGPVPVLNPDNSKAGIEKETKP
jgi:hypothetical protein